MQIAPGQQAPDFSLYDSDKNKITLSDLKGHNVIAALFSCCLYRNMYKRTLFCKRQHWLVQ
jgi:peroxiredoxin